MGKKPNQITVWSLVMINLAALGGIRSWAPIAECGSSSIFFLILGMVFFFLPLALVSAELATAWPQSGGVYGWVKEAFGHRLGFLAIWVLWVENVLYYPMILAFIVSTATFIFDSSLVHNKLYTFCSTLALFWCVTLANLKDIRASTWISSLGAICGTFIPGILLVFFGCLWYNQGNSLEISFSLEEIIPKGFSSAQLSLFATVIFSLFGIEMSAIHSGYVDQPQKKYPRAIFLSALIAIMFAILGVLSIAIVIPKAQIIFSAGSLQAFAVFTKAYQIPFLLQIMALIVAIGALGSMSTWVLGPCVGLISSATSNDFPALLRKTDSNGHPKNLLIAQACLVSVISFLFLFTPTINAAYWIFLILSTQLYLVMYILLFAAAIKLRYKYPNTLRPFSIPGGVVGMWLAGGVGLATSVFSLVISFLPPSQVEQGNTFYYVAALMVLLVLFSGTTLFYTSMKKIKELPKNVERG